MSGVDDGELATEVAARLDICRRPSWPEHDEFGGAAIEPDDKVAEGRAAVPVGPFQRTGASEEERHAFIANAELCRHSVRRRFCLPAPGTVETAQLVIGNKQYGN
jgi:hypothetical protein